MAEFSVGRLEAIGGCFPDAEPGSDSDDIQSGSLTEDEHEMYHGQNGQGD